MSKRIALLIFLLSLSGLLFTHPAKASSIEPLSNNQVFGFLEEAFQAQTSLTLEFRSYNKVRDILSPYFKDEFANLFLEENLFEEENGYIIYGSDFALYFIPFFSYSDDTKVIYDEIEQKVYVYELFKSPISGPVSYNDHYEIVIIEKVGSNWLISDITSSNEEPTITRVAVDKNDSSKDHISSTSKNSSVKPWSKLLIWNPFKFTLYSLLEMENRTYTYAGYFRGIF